MSGEAEALRHCCGCKQSFPGTGEFFNKGTRSDGLHSLCKTCHREYSKKFYEKDKDRQRVLQRDLYHDRCSRRPIEMTAARLLLGVNKRSREKGWVDTELTKEIISEKLESQSECECCGNPFHIGPKRGVHEPRSPSIDRFDNSLGYTISNSKLICRRCNELKRDADVEELRVILRYMER